MLTDVLSRNYESADASFTSVFVGGALDDLKMLFPVL